MDYILFLHFDLIQIMHKLLLNKYKYSRNLSQAQKKTYTI